MKNIIILRKLGVSLTFCGIIIYLMIKTTSPFFILIPFLVCGLSQVGVCIAAFANVKNAVKMMNIIYAISVGVYYFGFLIFALYLCIKEKNWGMIIFMIPFWIVGYYILKGNLYKNY